MMDPVQRREIERVIADLVRIKKMGVPPSHVYTRTTLAESIGALRWVLREDER